MARNPSPRSSELRNAFVQPIQSALSCFTRETLLTEPHFPGATTFGVRLTGTGLVQLGRRPGLSLWIGHTYRIAHRAGEWEVQTTAYSYWLFDRHGRELLLYQWDPDESSKVTTPHLHVRALGMLTAANLPDPPATDLVRRLVRAHLPTGHVTLTEVLRMAVDDLGVEPLETDAARLRQRLSTAEATLRASFAWQPSG